MPQKVIDQRVIAVYFDKNRRVERLANYGMKDGRVFDFISRTTPTGGKDTLTQRDVQAVLDPTPRAPSACSGSGNRFSEQNMRKIEESRAHHDLTQSGCALVPEPEVRAHRGANAIANFRFKSGTRIIELLAHVPEKWEPVFRIEHAQNRRI